MKVKERTVMTEKQEYALFNTSINLDLAVPIPNKLTNLQIQFLIDLIKEKIHSSIDLVINTESDDAEETLAIEEGFDYFLSKNTDIYDFDEEEIKSLNQLYDKIDLNGCEQTIVYNEIDHLETIDEKELEHRRNK